MGCGMVTLILPKRALLAHVIPKRSKVPHDIPKRSLITHVPAAARAATSGP